MTPGSTSSSPPAQPPWCSRSSTSLLFVGFERLRGEQSCARRCVKTCSSTVSRVPLGLFGALAGYVATEAGWWAGALVLLPVPFAPELVLVRARIARPGTHGGIAIRCVARCRSSPPRRLVVGALALFASLPDPAVLAGLVVLAFLAGLELRVDARARRFRRWSPRWWWSRSSWGVTPRSAGAVVVAVHRDRHRVGVGAGRWVVGAAARRRRRGRLGDRVRRATVACRRAGGGARVRARRRHADAPDRVDRARWCARRSLSPTDGRRSAPRVRSCSVPARSQRLPRRPRGARLRGGAACSGRGPRGTGPARTGPSCRSPARCRSGWRSRRSTRPADRAVLVPLAEAAAAGVAAMAMVGVRQWRFAPRRRAVDAALLLGCSLAILLAYPPVAGTGRRVVGGDPRCARSRCARRPSHGPSAVAPTRRRGVPRHQTTRTWHAHDDAARRLPELESRAASTSMRRSRSRALAMVRHRSLRGRRRHRCGA